MIYLIFYPEQEYTDSNSIKIILTPISQLKNTTY